MPTKDLIEETPVLKSEAEKQKSRSAFRCPTCGRAPTRKHEIRLISSDAAECPCGEIYDATEATVLVGQNSEKFLDLLTTRESIWWHGTHQHDWPRKPIEDPDLYYVHIGTYHAAYMRARQEKAAYLHKVVLYWPTKVSPIFLKDRGWWPQKIEGFDLADAYRYVNRWESPGSISLLVDPLCIKTLEVKKLTY